MIKDEKRMKKINKYLATLTTYVKLENKNGTFDINKYCEDFFGGLMNVVYNANLKNLNSIKINYPAVDLGDSNKRVAYQVTTDYSLGKIKKTVKTFIDHGLYKDYDKLFILIIGDKKPDAGVIDTKEKIDFSIKDNVFNLTDLSSQINALEKDQKQAVKKYLKNNLEHVGITTNDEEKKRIEISDKFKGVINYICKNDFHYTNVDILIQIENLVDEYNADVFFIKHKTPLLNDLSSLIEIVSFNAFDGLLKANDEVKAEIFKLRQSVVNEYERLILNK